MTHGDDRRSFDYVLVGGGLQSGLLAFALRHHRPDASVLLIERDMALGGNHTWSFHPGDVPVSSSLWIDPLIQYTWPAYRVRLGNFSRHVGLSYASICSDHFSELVGGLFDLAPESEERGRNESTTPSGDRSNALIGSPSPLNAGIGPRSDAEPSGHAMLMDTVPLESDAAEDASVTGKPADNWKLLTGTEVIHLSEQLVVTACGKAIRGKLVIDCRGPSADREFFSQCGYQKFFGFEVELTENWPLHDPLIMDASMDQTDGFRFMYALPFSPRRVLVEDTRFSDSPRLDRQQCLTQAAKYLHSHGITRFDIVREESGVLPMPFSSELRPEGRTPLSGGYAGGWFHAATGYSFPLAVAFAEAVASVGPGNAADAVNDLAKQYGWRLTYARFLNRLLFRLVADRKRHRIFRRFYRVLSDQAIERFYSHRFTARDAARIVLGMPPTVVGLRPLRFIRSFFEGDTR